ncbi:MAG: bifunctional nuclease domain-containing protein [Thermomicrobiales bacterium]
MIRFDVVGGAPQPDDDRKLVLLRETQGDRWIAMAVGKTEWAGIERAFDAKAGTQAGNGARSNPGADSIIPRVLIDSFANGKFGAHVIAPRGADGVSVLSRPADAIAFAIRADAPILVHRDVVWSTSLLRRAPESDADKRVLLFSRNPVAVFPQIRSARPPLMQRVGIICVLSVSALSLILSVIAATMTVGQADSSGLASAFSTAAVRFFALGLIGAMVAIAINSSRHRLEAAELHIHPTGPF